MSVSKLESLPNEILADLLEKYINGIDILKAFAFQLNRRFDAILAQCHRFRFDFMRCHKYDFRFCIGLLPAYIDRIEELALSEENTPGQIHAFLFFFPSFISFKQLRKLYLHINVEAVQPEIIENALHSLSETNLNTLSIKITKSQAISSLSYAIANIFRMKTLKKFSIDGGVGEIEWILLNDVSSNIEYLTISGLECLFEDLENIFRCASGLKYFNIQLNGTALWRGYRSKPSSQNSITRMPMLHTAIFIIQEHDETTPTTLEPYLKEMPSLRRLEIKSQNEFHGINTWETLFKTSLSKVTYFNFENSAHNSKDDHEKVLESIQNPSWIEKRNFHVVLKKFTYLDNDRFYSDDRKNFMQSESNRPVDQWWIGPRRKLNDNQSVTNTISSINLSTQSSSLLQDHYLGNVKYLVIREFNDNLLELLITHVDCSQIKHLDVSFPMERDNKISSLLPYIKNITSIRINFNQLRNDSPFVYLRECQKLRFVDLSSDIHEFNDARIRIIENFFPNIEHLLINTQDLQNVPLLQTYIPRLRSLTVANFDGDTIGSFSDDYERKMADENVRRKSKFLFQRGSNWTTIWIDQDALKDSYWATINRNSRRRFNNSWDE
jgi:hypothetical protein